MNKETDGNQLPTQSSGVNRGSDSAEKDTLKLDPDPLRGHVAEPRLKEIRTFVLRLGTMIESLRVYGNVSDTGFGQGFNVALTRCHDCVKAALASLPVSEPSGAPVNAGWRDISTAPKDGTRILVVGTGDRWQLGPVVARTLTGYDGWYSLPGKHHVQPTFWMPLPSPPEATR